MKKLNIKFPVTCKTGEVSTSYKDYLLTEHWKDVKNRYRLSKYPKVCNICDSKDKPLDLHHKSYKRIGNEYLMDLIYLCRECHNSTHETYKKQTSIKKNLWNAHKPLKKKHKKL